LFHVKNKEEEKKLFPSKKRKIINKSPNPKRNRKERRERAPGRNDIKPFGLAI
jgi:hypothetical protein